jgi:hypothetical protein
LHRRYYNRPSLGAPPSSGDHCKTEPKYQFKDLGIVNGAASQNVDLDANKEVKSAWIPFAACGASSPFHSAKYDAMNSIRRGWRHLLVSQRGHEVISIDAD